MSEPEIQGELHTMNTVTGQKPIAVVFSAEQAADFFNDYPGIVGVGCVKQHWLTTASYKFCETMKDVMTFYE